MRPLRNNRSVVSVKYANKCLLVREGGNLSEENYGVVLGVFVQLGRLNKKLLLPLSGNKTVSVHIGDALPPGFTRSHAKKDCSHKELIVNLTADFETCFLISSRRFWCCSVSPSSSGCLNPQRGSLSGSSTVGCCLTRHWTLNKTWMGTTSLFIQRETETKILLSCWLLQERQTTRWEM